MSILSSIVNIGDSTFIDVLLTIKRSEKCTIDVPDSYIYSSSVGQLVGKNKIEITNYSGKVNLLIQNRSQSINVIVTYLNSNKVTEQQSFQSVPVSPLPVGEAVNVTRIQTGRSSISERKSILQKQLTHRSRWKVSLTADTDIFLRVKSRGESDCWMCIGEHTNDLRGSDLVFKVDQSIKNLVIPIDAIQTRFDFHLPLGCYEIVQSDMSAIPGIFYKSLISNQITLNDSMRRTTEQPTTPTGLQFEHE